MECLASMELDLTCIPTVSMHLLDVAYINMYIYIERERENNNLLLFVRIENSEFYFTFYFRCVA